MDRGVMVVGERWRYRGSQGNKAYHNDMGRMAYPWCGLYEEIWISGARLNKFRETDFDFASF